MKMSFEEEKIVQKDKKLEKGILKIIEDIANQLEILERKSEDLLKYEIYSPMEGFTLPHFNNLFSAVSSATSEYNVMRGGLYHRLNEGDIIVKRKGV